MPQQKTQMPPVHPGEILREDLMKPLGLTVNGLARTESSGTQNERDRQRQTCHQCRCSAAFVALLR
jgi:hypothetical protein